MSQYKLHIQTTKKLAKKLKQVDVFSWLVEHGYFPESYVLPPCFRVKKKPPHRQQIFQISANKKQIVGLNENDLFVVRFPRTDLTDREFGIINPDVHNDIAYHISRNWKSIVDAMIPDESDVACYSFPVPLDKKHPGRLGLLRSGRMIYEYLWMTEEDLAAGAFNYDYVVKADIKGFYPTIYTHSIAWALHGKKNIRKPANRRDLKFIGNRLDRLFQYGNSGKTNGLPIGPVVSDIVAEIIASAVDVELTNRVKKAAIKCEMVRFKDDYRILVKSQSDGQRVIKLLQESLAEYDLNISESKTSVNKLPDGLFRPWVSEYHEAYPRKRAKLKWREFKELYLAVLRIDENHPGTGVIDRFLADIVDKRGVPKVGIMNYNLHKAISMLILLSKRRPKCFPKVLAIIESVFQRPMANVDKYKICEHLEEYMLSLSQDERANSYQLCWLSYFFVSNGLKNKMNSKPILSLPITKSAFNNRPYLFKSSLEFELFEGCVSAGKRTTMLQHLDVFNPAAQT